MAAERMKGKVSKKILDLIEKLPRPTEEQLASLDEYGEWIKKPESQESSTMGQEET
jgi:hypothetical protein